jgi:hypothetical protein
MILNMHATSNGNLCFANVSADWSTDCLWCLAVKPVTTTTAASAMWGLNQDIWTSLVRCLRGLFWLKYMNRFLCWSTDREITICWSFNYDFFVSIWRDMLRFFFSFTKGEAVESRARPTQETGPEPYRWFGQAYSWAYEYEERTYK